MLCSVTQYSTLFLTVYSVSLLISFHIDPHFIGLTNKWNRTWWNTISGQCSTKEWSKWYCLSIYHPHLSNRHLRYLILQIITSELSVFNIWLMLYTKIQWVSSSIHPVLHCTNCFCTCRHFFDFILKKMASAISEHNIWLILCMSTE